MTQWRSRLVVILGLTEVFQTAPVFLKGLQQAVLKQRYAEQDLASLDWKVWHWDCW